MRITIEHYGQKFIWENKYGAKGLPFMNKDYIDETNLEDVIPVISALLVAAGYHEQTIKDLMYDYGREEFNESL